MPNKLLPGELYGRVCQKRQVGGFSFFQTSYLPRFSIPSHFHECSYLSFVVRGEIQEKNRTVNKNLGPDALIFYPPGEIHSESFQSVGGILFNVEFDSTRLGRINDFQGDLLIPTILERGVVS